MTCGGHKNGLFSHFRLLRSADRERSQINPDAWTFFQFRLIEGWMKSLCMLHRALPCRMPGDHMWGFVIAFAVLVGLVMLVKICPKSSTEISVPIFPTISRVPGTKCLLLAECSVKDYAMDSNILWLWNMNLGATLWLYAVLGHRADVSCRWHSYLGIPHFPPAPFC